MTNGAGLAGKESDIRVTDRPGDLTRVRHRRTAVSYGVLLVVGALLLGLASSPAWQALGVGLWFPGAGFLAVGGAWSALTAAALLLFFVSLVAWIGAGFTTAPPLIWIGSAVVAAVLAKRHDSRLGVVVAVIIVALGIVAGMLRRYQRGAKATKLRTTRLDYLPRALGAVSQRAVAASKEDTLNELTREAVTSLRYVFDRALQPIGEYEGYDRLDQFQTAALRYQINTFGYALAVMQAHYTRNFHGYGTEAQRRLIETYLDRKVWGYWRYENAWGNLRLNGDPVGKDNIMLTGFYGLQVGLYTALTGDQRYTRRGGLSFRHNGAAVYEHDLGDIAGSLAQNFRNAPFCLYPCEPNWAYTACNFRGMSALQVYDRVAGTSFFGEFRDPFRLRLETEFINPDLTIVALRSMLTGIALPFPLPEGIPAVYLNSMFPDLARRYWAIVREEEFVEDDRRLTPRVQRGAIDTGNYKLGHALALEALYGAAQEHGDTEAAEAALAALGEACELTDEGGVLRYRQMSNSVNGCVALDRMLFLNAWQSTVLTPTRESALNGPVLDCAEYPHVLVARATSDGVDLNLVLYPGGSDGERDLALARLTPGCRYEATSPEVTREFTADNAGCAVVRIPLSGRTTVTVCPTSDT